MKQLLLIALLAVGMTAQAQITKASLQASGLTCSMCSKAVKLAIEELSFVDKVQVDIKNQQYNVTFKDGQAFQVDELQKAVADAGFSVAKLSITAKVEEKQLNKDEHLKIGNHTFHFLNAANQTINGEATFTVVDKNFVSAKDFKKYSALSKMACVQTGKMEACCSSGGEQAPARIYHVII
jgi:copper chaperone CopZ